ncbi:MAG: hypothetical protein KIT44_16055 [Opitutaceae bacterium]|nr:hypothetical protein [Opitutaceae bacterium]
MLIASVWRFKGPQAGEERLFSPVGEAHGSEEITVWPARPAPAPWLPPASQKRGPAWVYDVFTPPEIRHDPATGRFLVAGESKPAALVTAAAGTAAWQLVTVEREPFPLQLTGHVGGEVSYLGIFENVATGETVLAGAGRTFPELGLRIVRFAVESRSVAIPESMTVQERIALAVMRNPATGEEVQLTDRQPAHLPGLRARLRRLPGDGEEVIVREQDVVALGDRRYRIDKIRLAPPAVELSQIAPESPVPERRTLVPAASLSDPP